MWPSDNDCRPILAVGFNQSLKCELCKFRGVGGGIEYCGPEVGSRFAVWPVCGTPCKVAACDLGIEKETYRQGRLRPGSVQIQVFAHLLGDIN